MFHSLKENVFQWGKIRKLEKLNTEVSAILTDLVNDKKQDVVIKRVMEMAKKHIDFETCILYEWLPGNKLKMLYSDISYRTVLKYKEKMVFQNKKLLFKGNDMCPQDDEGAIYHPVVIGRKMRYIFIFDETDMDSYEEKRRERYGFYKELELIMGNLRNRTLANRAQYVDSLTGLPNERQLRKDIEYCIVSEKDYIFAIIELDDMRELNEKYGMDFGDRVIRKAKKVVEQYVRSGDGVYRYIGARLAILLSGTQEKQFSIVKKIHNELCSTVLTTGKQGNVFCPVTIGALEIRYLDEKSVDYAYERCRHALTVERGGICYVGERREVQLFAEKEQMQEDFKEKTLDIVSECQEEERVVVEEKVTENISVEYSKEDEMLGEQVEEEKNGSEEEIREEESGEESFGYSDEDIAEVVNEGVMEEEYSETEEVLQCSADNEETGVLEGPEEDDISEPTETEMPEKGMNGTEDITKEIDCEPDTDKEVSEEMCIDALSIMIPPESMEEKEKVTETVTVGVSEDVAEKTEKIVPDVKDVKENSSKKEDLSEWETTVQSMMLDAMQNGEEAKKPVRTVNISELENRKSKGGRRRTKKKIPNEWGTGGIYDTMLIGN